jgi:hypothetical protein
LCAIAAMESIAIMPVYSFATRYKTSNLHPVRVQDALRIDRALQRDSLALSAVGVDDGRGWEKGSVIGLNHVCSTQHAA